MNGFNLSNITDARLGGTQLSAIYLGSSKLWPLISYMYKKWSDYEKQYLTIEALEDGCYLGFWRAGSSSYTAPSFTIDYSINGGTWDTSTFDEKTTSVITNMKKSNNETLYLNKGDKLRLRATRQNWGKTTGFYGARDTSFNFYKKVKIYGNINSLVKGDNFYKNYNVSDVNTQGMFTNLFNMSSTYKANLVDISNLFIPSYKFAVKGSDENSNATNSMQFDSTFANCTAITKLPMMDLYVQGNEYFRYYNLFSYDSALTDAENFVLYSNSNSLGYYGLSNMLSNCTSLAKAPKLNVKGVTTGSFANFYESDTSLNDVEINITTLGSGFNGPWCNNTTSLTQIKTNKYTETSNTNFISGKTLVASKFIDPGYFTIESLEDNNLIEFKCNDTYNMYWDVWVNGTKVKHNWSSTQGSYTTIATLNKGDIMQIMQNSSTLFKVCGGITSNITHFKTSGKFIIYGSLETLTKNTLNGWVASGANFNRLFQDCTGLVDAYHLICPTFSDSTSTYYGYTSTFRGCTSLERAPRILKSAGYWSMHTFQYMFGECTSLYEGPEIILKYLPDVSTFNDIDYMFNGCDALEYVGVRIPDYTITSILNASNWLNVADASKLTVNTNMWRRGNSGASYIAPGNGSSSTIPADATLINNNFIY